MALKWTDWEKDPKADPKSTGEYLTPYADWYLNVEQPKTEHGRITAISQRGAPENSPFPFVMHDLPLPAKAIAGGSKRIGLPAPRKNVLDGLSIKPGKDDVIIGVIDAGLALSHERFRRAGGVGTRILSHWAQGGEQGQKEKAQPHLPFGRELMQKEIDNLMGPDPAVDEAAFNHAAGLVDFSDPAGERWIETAAPHGTHVADLAAGCDPMDPDQAAFRDKAHLILVDLAPRLSIGPAGSFLEDCAIWAIRHIVETADAIWQALYPDEPEKSFPVVINLSYGFNAGPKAGTAALQKYVRLLNFRREGKSAPVRLVMPAGNDNLSQGSAILWAQDGKKDASLGWRILPEDRTSSYVEVWVDPDEAAQKRDLGGPGPISVTPPSGPKGPGTAGQPGQFCQLQDEAGRPVARIYCRQSDTLVHVTELDTEATSAIGYTLCVAPTWRLDGPVAPSGKWTISLDQVSFAKLHVQSDQSLVPGYGSSQLSYFEDNDDTPKDQLYQRFNADSSLRDTYWLDPADGTVHCVDSDGPIRRQNTMNALAGAALILTIAGYRATDGWPAAYSATARGFSVGGNGESPRDAPDKWAESGGGKGVMEASCISDDGAWHIGRLAAGGRSGSAVVMQGTSFATAEATRIVAHLLLQWAGAGRPNNTVASAPEFTQLAEQHEVAALANSAFSAKAEDLWRKLGFGRFPRQNHGRVDRVIR